MSSPRALHAASGGDSVQELNSLDKDTLKKLVTDYSTNVKNYAKWFEINQVFKNEDSYTKYNVIYRVGTLFVSFV